MRYAPFHELRTPRLCLRKLQLEDAPCFFTQLGGNEQVAKSMMWIPHQTLSESEASIRKALQRYESGQFYRWAITLRESGALIGIIDLLRFDEESSTCSFAYMLSPDHWNKGYGTEAVKEVFSFAFRELEMEVITADHFADNPASGAVMRKAGMTRIGVTAAKYEKQGTLHDAVYYRISKEEWESK